MRKYDKMMCKLYNLILIVRMESNHQRFVTLYQNVWSEDRIWNIFDISLRNE